MATLTAIGTTDGLSGATINITAAAGVPAGSFIAVFVRDKLIGGQALTPPTDAVGNRYVAVCPPQYVGGSTGNNALSLYICGLCVPLGIGQTISYTPQGSGGATVSAAYITGLYPAFNPDDGLVSAFTASSTTSFSPGAVPQPTPSDFVIWGAVNNGGAAITSGTLTRYGSASSGSGFFWGTATPGFGGLSGPWAAIGVAYLTQTPVQPIHYVFIPPGTTQFVVPPDFRSLVLIGGWGSGASGIMGSSGSGGNGGAAGAWAQQPTRAGLTQGAIINCQVGIVGGTQGTKTTPGTADTWFDSSTATLYAQGSGIGSASPGLAANCFPTTNAANGGVGAAAATTNGGGGGGAGGPNGAGAAGSGTGGGTGDSGHGGTAGLPGAEYTLTGGGTVGSGGGGVGSTSASVAGTPGGNVGAGGGGGFGSVGASTPGGLAANGGIIFAYNPWFVRIENMPMLGM
jgi:hypothetical protein